MNHLAQVKITVLRKISAQDIFGDQVTEIVEDGYHNCRRTRVGMEFIVKEDGIMPQGFCSHAWHDISPQVWTLQCGTEHPSMKNKGEYYCTCHDGVHPVLYKLERL